MILCNCPEELCTAIARAAWAIPLHLACCLCRGNSLPSPLEESLPHTLVCGARREEVEFVCLFGGIVGVFCCLIYFPLWEQDAGKEEESGVGGPRLKGNYFCNRIKSWSALKRFLIQTGSALAFKGLLLSFQDCNVIQTVIDIDSYISVLAPRIAFLLPSAKTGMAFFTLLTGQWVGILYSCKLWITEMAVSLQGKERLGAIQLLRHLHLSHRYQLLSAYRMETLKRLLSHLWEGRVYSKEHHGYSTGH